MSYLPTAKQKLATLVEYSIEVDEDESVPDETSVPFPISPRLEFEYDKYHTTEVFKGVLYGLCIGFGIGFYLGRLSKKS